MEMKLSDIKDKESLIQFIKFGIVGVTNTLLGLFIYYIFVLINKELYQLGNVVGWLISVAWSCYWNNKYVFTQKQNSKEQWLKRLMKSYVSYGSTFLFTVFLLHAEIEWWHWSEKISPIANLLITIPLNFILNKFWTFSAINIRMMHRPIVVEEERINFGDNTDYTKV